MGKKQRRKSGKRKPERRPEAGRREPVAEAASDAPAAPPPAVDELLEAGEAHYGAGRVDDAERCFRAALDRAPENARALNDLAVLLFERGDAGPAIELFTRLVDQDPFDRVALTNLDAVLRHFGRGDLAVPSLRRYLERFPDDAEVRALLARHQGPSGAAAGGGRRLRIFVGTRNIASYAENLAEGFRALGHDAVTVERFNEAKFYKQFRPDHRLAEVLGESRITARPDGSLDVELAPEAREFILGFDVYVFIAAQSFLPGGMDLPLLRQQGKKIVAWLCGSECRHWAAAGPMWEALGSRLPDVVRNVPEDASGTRLVDVIRHGAYHNTLANKLHNTRMAELYADVIYSVPETFGLGLRPYMSIPAPLDLDKFTFHVPGREVPVVVHAPSDRGFKQTRLILDTLERLRSDGVRFELRLLENVPHERVAAALADADVVIDQMSLYPALLAHEAMASGCAVLTGNVPAALPLPHGKPLVHIEPGNLEAEARRVLTDRALRVDLAERGRRYVERHSDRVRIAEAILGHLEQGPALRPDCYPHFFAEAFERPPSEPIPDYLQRFSFEVLTRFGAPPDVDLTRMLRAGLLLPDAAAHLESIPRWTAPTRQLGPWVRCRPDIWPTPVPTG